MGYALNPFTGNFDNTGTPYTLDIGDTIGNSPVANGLLYSDGGLLSNDLISIQEDSFFAGAVTAKSFDVQTYANFPTLGWVDATGFGANPAVGVLTPGVAAQFFFMIDTNSLSARGALNYDPSTPTNSYFGIALANGMGGTPEINISTTAMGVYVPIETRSGEIYSIGDGKSLDLYTSSGTSTDAYGGDFNYNGGAGNGAGWGGSFYVSPGTGGNSNGQGGIVSIFGGTGGTGGNGGDLDIGAGAGGSGGDGGNATIWAGDGAGGGTHGSIRFRYNGSTSATNGQAWVLQDATTGRGAWATIAAGIDGSGASTRVAYWTDTDTLASENTFTYDATNNRLTTTGGYRMNAGSSNTIGDVDGNGSIYFDSNGVHLNPYSSVYVRDYAGQYAFFTRSGIKWEATGVDTGPFGGGNYDAGMIISGGNTSTYDTKAFATYFGGRAVATANGDKLYGVVFRPQFTVGAYTGLTKIGMIAVTPDASSIGMIVKGTSSQSVDMFQIRNSSDTVLSSFGSGGNLGIGGAATSTSKLNIQSIPTSSAGLATGDVWSDSGTLKIV